MAGLITSQIDTVPKHGESQDFEGERLITSQIDTVPKRVQPRASAHASLITSQIDTVPKLGTILAAAIGV